MSLFAIIINGIVYSFGLVVTLGGFLVARARSRGRLRAFARTTASVFAVVALFSLQQIIDLMRGSALSQELWEAIYPLTEIGFVLTVLTCCYFFCRFLVVAAEPQLPAPLRRIYPWLVLGFGLSHFIVFALRYGARSRLLAMEGSIGLPDIVATASLFLMLIYVVLSWTRLRAAPLQRLKVLFLALLLTTIALEICLYLIPDSFWSKLAFSKYLFEMDILSFLYFSMSALYILAEWREAPQAAAPLRAGEKPLLTGSGGEELSPREKEVVDCLLKGMSNREISDALYISLSTVKTHIHKILEKTDQPSRMSLVAWISRAGTQNQSLDR